MHIPTIFIASLFAGFQLASAGDCTAFSACVHLFSPNIGSPSMEFAAYNPDCSGHCYVADVAGVMIKDGSGLHTDCIFYSDQNCGSPIPGHEDDHGVGGAGGQFYDFGGQVSGSHQCYWDCH
ncbi:hypothetical protein BGZ63DRAFT_403131 [Mariannaea sp. PMI_226]|nr:hypothetical protein BGZ63DRAFT_403131 [Mariannaea sp. PMI_226]